MPIIGSAQSYSTIVISPSLPQCTALEVCPNDTLRFVGDSTNSNFYGTVEGWVYNSLSQSNDYFTITSHNSIETSYEHVVVQGDSSYYWEWCMYGNFPPPHGLVLENCVTTSSEEVNALSSEIFPNPTTNKLNFLFPNTNQSPLNISIYDNMGRLIYRQEGIRENQLQVDVSKYPSGIYHYELLNQESRERGFGDFVKR